MVFHKSDTCQRINKKKNTRQNDWSFVEVLVDFAAVRQLYYERILGLHNLFAELPDDPSSLDHGRFTVEIQVEIGGQQRLDVDHIAFLPMAMAEQEIVVYNELDWMNPTAVIQLSEGLVRRTFYNSLGQEKATQDKLGHTAFYFEPNGPTDQHCIENGHSGHSLVFSAAIRRFDETFDNFSLMEFIDRRPGNCKLARVD